MSYRRRGTGQPGIRNCRGCRPYTIRIITASELAATLPPKGYSLMQKAHLYEALYLVNHGIDEAVRGVQRLKKAPHAFREVYYKSVAGLERRRALINGQFMHEMGGEEEDNASFFEEELHIDERKFAVTCVAACNESVMGHIRF